MATTKRTKTGPNPIPALTIEIHALRENAESIVDQAKRLEESLRLARGTGDHTAKAHAASGENGSLFIGDDTDTPTVIATVRRALIGRARTLRELIETTGVRRNRISGALVKLQVAGVKVQNLGDETRAIWFIAPAKSHRG